MEHNVSLSVQPVAVVLGSDNKPAKLRLYIPAVPKTRIFTLPSIGIVPNTEIAIEPQVIDLYLSDYHIERYWNIKHTDTRVIIPNCSWLPVLDQSGHIIKDGISLQYLLRSDSDALCDLLWYAFDARGACKQYDVADIVRIACKDKNRAIFTNLQYNLCPSQVGITSEQFIISDFSRDIADLYATTGICPGADFDGSMMHIGKEFFSQDNAIMPDTWIKLSCVDIFNVPVRNIVFPSSMYFLLVRLQNFNNLTSIRFPDTLNADKLCTICIKECPNLRNVKLPDSILTSALCTFEFRNCDALESVTLPETAIAPDNTIQFVFRDCPNLRNIVFRSNLSADCVRIRIIDCPVEKPKNARQRVLMTF